jgi:hypothetical protein
MMTPIPLDHWVSDNNPPTHLQYGKGWWDYIEILRRVVEKFDVEHVDVVGTYVMETPPPQEELLMPVVRLRMGAVELIVKYDFGTFPDTWTVSARIPKRIIASTFGLFDPDLRLEKVAGFDTSWVYPPYSVGPERFSCELRDEWDLAAFVRLIVGEAHA